jgi:hypothetical protein
MGPRRLDVIQAVLEQQHSPLYRSGDCATARLFRKPTEISARQKVDPDAAFQVQNRTLRIYNLAMQSMEPAKIVLSFVQHAMYEMD